MSKRPKVPNRISVRTTPETNRILADELAAMRSDDITAAVNKLLLIASKPNFRAAYRQALISAIKRLEAELRNFDAE